MRRQETAGQWWRRWPVWRPSAAFSSPGSHHTTVWPAAAGSLAERRTKERGSGDKACLKGKETLNKENRKYKTPRLPPLSHPEPAGSSFYSLLFFSLSSSSCVFVFLSSSFLLSLSPLIFFLSFVSPTVSVFPLNFGWINGAHVLPATFRSSTRACQSDVVLRHRSLNIWRWQLFSTHLSFVTRVSWIIDPATFYLHGPFLRRRNVHVALAAPDCSSGGGGILQSWTGWVTIGQRTVENKGI